jgi:cephalosporin hydroxylase
LSGSCINPYKLVKEQKIKLKRYNDPVWEFLKTHYDFVIDKDIPNKLLIIVAPDGYLRKIK